MTMTAEAVEVDTTWTRRGSDTKRRRCVECREVIAAGTDFVQVHNPKVENDLGEAFKHFICAGMAGEVKTCTECFMISSNCICA